jgi:hypothetical protein
VHYLALPYSGAAFLPLFLREHYWACAMSQLFKKQVQYFACPYRAGIFFKKI